jgi:hypothetical protein
MTSLNQFCQMLKTQIDNALRPYCFVRGGVSVSTADRKLNIKVSGMTVYSFPTIDFTPDVAEYWLNAPGDNVPFETDEGSEFEP